MLHAPKRNEIMRRRQVSARLPLLCIKSQLGSVCVYVGGSGFVFSDKKFSADGPSDPSEGLPPPPPVAAELQHDDGGHLPPPRVLACWHPASGRGRQVKGQPPFSALLDAGKQTVDGKMGIFRRRQLGGGRVRLIIRVSKIGVNLLRNKHHE